MTAFNLNSNTKNLGQFAFYLLILLLYTNCKIQDQRDISLDGEQTALLVAISKFNSAFQMGDTPTIESMITENYTHTNGNAKAIGREVWLDYIKNRNREIKDGTLVITGYEMTETEIEQFGNTAIVTAKISVKSTKVGIEQENEYRVTNIWIQENGQWKRAGFHDGKIK